MSIHRSNKSAYQSPRIRRDSLATNRLPSRNQSTGDYEAGGDNNQGLGMWSYELFAGTTLYFDEARTWHFSATAFYENHGKRDGADIRVGDILTVEDGLGKSFVASLSFPIPSIPL